MNVLSRYGSVILASIFFLAGTLKLAGLDFETEAFERWGYPIWFMYLVGSIEVTGAVILLIKPLQMWAAAGLSLFMMGPIITHFLFAEWAMMLVAFIIMLFSAYIAWQSRKMRSEKF